jgi:hypothetical protein
VKLTPGRQAQAPNSVQDCWDALASGLRCITGFGKGNGHCHTHALELLRGVIAEGDAKS